MKQMYNGFAISLQMNRRPTIVSGLTLIVAIWIVTYSAPVFSALTPAPPSIQKILIWVKASDPTTVTELELDVMQALADHHVAAEAFFKLFPQGISGSVSETVAQMRASGCDALLVMRRIPAIRWEPAKTAASSSL